MKKSSWSLLFIMRNKSAMIRYTIFLVNVVITFIVFVIVSFVIETSAKNEIKRTIRLIKKTV
jgi:hypothetical protein